MSKARIKTEDALLWLQENKKLLNRAEVARRIGINLRTLVYFLDGQRPLPEKWIDPVVAWVRSFLSVGNVVDIK